MNHVIRVRGTIGPKVLGKSQELFRQDIRTILSELLQNARRAGAHSVAVTTGGPGDGFLTMTDDGHGVNNMQKLVTFGDSGWDATLDAVENAAGMGMFAVASRGATVRSNGSKVVLSPSVFLGVEDAVVLPDPEPAAGTSVTFPLAPKELAAVEGALRLEATFLPMPVTLDGVAVPQADFLNGCLHVVEWQGVRIGVADERSRRVVLAHGSERFSHRKLNVNFHGHALHNEAIDRIGFDEMERKLQVFVDIVNAHELRLVLPTRDAVIENAFFARLLDRATDAKLEAIALQPHHTLSMQDRDAAAARGIRMDLPRLVLRASRIGDTHDGGVVYDSLQQSDTAFLGYRNQDQAKVLRSLALHDDNSSAVQASALIDILHGQPSAATIQPIEPNAGYAGHPVYEAIRRIANIRVEFTAEDGTAATYPLDEDRYEEQEAVERLVASEDGCFVATALTLAADLVERDGTKRTISVQDDYAFVGEENAVPSMSSFIALRTASPADMADTLRDRFRPMDDEGTSEEFYDDALARFASILQTPLQARMTAIENALLGEGQLLNAQGIKSITMRARRDKHGFTRMVGAIVGEDGTRRSFTLR